MPKCVVGPSILGWKTEEEAIYLFADDPRDPLDISSAKLVVQTILREQVMEIEDERGS